MSFNMTKIEAKPEIQAGRSNYESETILKARFSDFANKVDLTAVKFKLIKEKGWTLGQANEVETQYKAFLFLIGSKDKYQLVPTHDIDEMWHAHILDTRQYMADCARHFGAYIHHYPYLGMKDETDATRAKDMFEGTRKVMAQKLGVRVGGYDLADCGGGCSGGCSSGSCSSSSCSSSSCSSGHSSCSSGGHHTPSHTPTNNDSSVYTPLISSCSTSSTNDQPSRRRTPEPDKSKRTPTPPRPVEKRRGILSRILGLMPQEQREWYMSVTPEHFAQGEYRPDMDALNAIGQLRKSTLH